MPIGRGRPQSPPFSGSRIKERKLRSATLPAAAARSSAAGRLLSLLWLLSLLHLLHLLRVPLLQLLRLSLVALVHLLRSRFISPLFCQLLMLLIMLLLEFLPILILLRD
jgi:hypothetical protein